MGSHFIHSLILPSPRAFQIYLQVNVLKLLSNETMNVCGYSTTATTT